MPAQLTPITVRISANDRGTRSCGPVGDDHALIDAIQELCDDFRSHLLRRGSDGTRSSTLLLYLQILTEVHGALRQHDSTFTAPLPTVETLEDHLAQFFPEVWLGGGTHGLYEKQCWGRVDTIWRDKIMVWRQVVVLLEKRMRDAPYSQGGLELSSAQAYHLAFGIIAQEITHHLVRRFYGTIMTPPGIGRDEFDKNGNLNGESGWRFEWELFGGNLVVEWMAGEENEWKLGRIYALLFELPHSGPIYNIPSTAAADEAISVAILDQVRTSNSIEPIDPVRVSLSISQTELGRRDRVGLKTQPPSPTRLPYTLLPAHPTGSTSRQHPPPPPGTRY